MTREERTKRKQRRLAMETNYQVRVWLNECIDRLGSAGMLKGLPPEVYKRATAAKNDCGWAVAALLRELDDMDAAHD